MNTDFYKGVNQGSPTRYIYHQHLLQVEVKRRDLFVCQSFHCNFAFFFYYSAIVVLSCAVLDVEYCDVIKSSLSQRVYGISRAGNSIEVLNRD